MIIETTDADKDPEKRWQVIDLQEAFGIKPIRCNEGCKIDIMVKVANDDMRRCYYGTSGYRDQYSKLPD